jgi:hypothetical protein
MAYCAMGDKHRAFVDDPIARRAIAVLERQGLTVRGRSAEETIRNLKRRLAENPTLAADLAQGRPAHATRRTNVPRKQADRSAGKANQ